jgi:hypothetical protein
MPTLAVFRSHPVITSVFLLIYSVAVTLPHQKVQDWLFIAAVQPLGRINFYRIMAALGVAALTAAGVLIARRLPQHPARHLIRNYSLFTLILILLAWRYLSVNNSELVHFPQYALTGFVLMALTLSATESLSWVVLLGGLDEANQYAIIHGNWGIPYDFNDVVLDLLGGMIGVLLCLLWLHATPRPVANLSLLLKPGILLLGVTVAVGGLMLLTNHAVIYQDAQRTDYWFALSRLPSRGFWFYDETWGPRTIHQIAPLEGPILLLALVAAYWPLDRAFQFRTRS